MKISLGHLLSNEKTHDGSPSEMEEETPSDLFDINHDVPKALSMAEEYENEGSLFSFDFQDWNDRVYVAVGKTSESSSSMDALAWTLEHVVSPTTLVQLIHVFPVVRHIPSPCKLSLFLFGVSYSWSNPCLGKTIKKRVNLEF